MGITNVNSTATTPKTYNANSTKQTDNANTTKKSENSETKANQIDELLQTEKNDKENGYVNDVKYTPDMDTVNKMIKEAEAKMASFINMVEKLVMKQGHTFVNIFDTIRQGLVEVDEETMLKAQEDISEDGYFGVKKTSERIFDFAVAISGGDPSKIDMLREAVDKGFKEAEKLWGGELPEISKQTYDAVMKKFDEWAEQSNQSTGTTETPDVASA